VGLRAALIVPLCAALAVPAALAQKSTEDGLNDCEKFAAVKFKQENPSFKAFTIDRKDVEEDKFAAKVGSQYVATVYHGKATYQDTNGASVMGFICLHGGLGKGAVFVYVLPN
jgi:hypothetical protein